MKQVETFGGAVRLVSIFEPSKKFHEDGLKIRLSVEKIRIFPRKHVFSFRFCGKICREWKRGIKRDS